ncbi:2,3-diaminopropionate biosynthesis protein SbnA [Streptomyces yangpuensis]|uniref:2,3-diaminopropionate biosynthesis protein SbnA n=1 Tax=Streptomyces yangpuensis TaxID=1648182 RepID=UPI00383015F7
MPAISMPHETLESNTYVDLRAITGRDFHLKCEGFNFAGSVKMRTAAGLISAAERDGLIKPDSILIESSSGNLGLAIAAISANKGMRFVCVTDPKCNRSTKSLLQALGAEVIVVSAPETEGGYLSARLDYVRNKCAGDARYVWLNQYANPASWTSHYETTAVEIAKDFPDLDVLFVGAGTGGTLMGCARYFRENGHQAKIVAVDACGSVSFGGAPGKRMIPGLGTGVRPQLLDPSFVDDVIHVPEPDTVRCCRALARKGFLLGGSTGTVVSGAVKWLELHDPQRRLRAVGISPDLADRYAHTIYDDHWVVENFGAEVLDSPTIPGLYES